MVASRSNERRKKNNHFVLPLVAVQAQTVNRCSFFVGQVNTSFNTRPYTFACNFSRFGFGSVNSVLKKNQNETKQ